MNIKKLMTVALIVAPLTGFAINCPDPSVFQKAFLVKQDSGWYPWNVFQSAPQAVNGWTILFNSLSITNIAEANHVLKTAHPKYGFNNGVYCSYVDKSIAGASFAATKTNGPTPGSASSNFHP